MGQRCPGRRVRGRPGSPGGTGWSCLCPPGSSCQSWTRPALLELPPHTHLHHTYTHTGHRAASRYRGSRQRHYGVDLSFRFNTNILPAASCRPWKGSHQARITEDITETVQGQARGLCWGSHILRYIESFCPKVGRRAVLQWLCSLSLTSRKLTQMTSPGKCLYA